MESIISNELLNKYKVQDINVLVDMSGETLGQIVHYNDFLQKTDHIPNKIIEGTLSTADCADVLAYREIARQQIAELSGQPYEPKENVKTLDERTAAMEEDATLMLGTDSNKKQASKQLRKAMQIFAQTLTEEEAMEIATIYPAYEVGKAYKFDEFLTYGVNSVGDPQLYKVVQAHTSQEDWKPDATPALYTPIGLTEEGYPVWSQPSGAQDAYNTGDIVDYNGTLYKSIIDGNVWSPEAYPAGWEVYTETEG